VTQQSPPPPRKLSCFFSRELFSLYIEDKLDKQRVLQVQEHLDGCSSCPALLEKMKKSKKLLEELSDIKVSKEMIDYLKREHFFWSEFAEKTSWRNWHPTAKWASQLTTVALSLTIIIHYFPWRNVARKIKHLQPVAQNQMVIEKAKTNVVGATDALEKLAPQMTPPIAHKKPVQTKEEEEITETTGNVAAPVPTSSPTPTPVAVSENSMPLQTPSNPESPGGPIADETKNEDEASEAIPVSKETSQKYKGFVWRGSLKVDELGDELADRVTKTITDLGGTKAGQVELGWRRGSSRYYHFIFPEDNYEKLLSELNQEGILQLTKERHPRIIKSGYMRIIMTLEESQ
jgi:hypothetical protein